MKNFLLIPFIIICLSLTVSCDSSEEEENLSQWQCGTHNGNTLYTGPQGGCYYYNSNNNKTYVDRSECNC